MQTENAKTHFIKIDDNTIINEKGILWIKKMENCLEVCTKTTGCKLGFDTHKICKFDTPDSYNNLNVLFE
jgi:hypothetical protein